VDRQPEIDCADFEMALPAPQRLRHGPEELTGQEEAGKRQDDERGPPVDRARHETADDEPERRPRGLADEDVGPDAPALAGAEVVPGQRGDRGPGAGRHRTEGQPREQQAPEAAGERAHQRRKAPEHDGERKQRHPPRAVHQQPDGDREDGADEQRDGAEQADVGVVDVKRGLELRCDRPDGCRVGAIEREHGGEQDDHPRPRRAPHAPDHLPADAATAPPRDPPQEPQDVAGQMAPGAVGRAGLVSHGSGCV
jgi:hypothetical protein